LHDLPGSWLARANSFVHKRIMRALILANSLNNQKQRLFSLGTALAKSVYHFIVGASEYLNTTSKINDESQEFF
jgi:hypothetical protein